jgi:hypothetical protein
MVKKLRRRILYVTQIEPRPSEAALVANFIHKDQEDSKKAVKMSYNGDVDVSKEPISRQGSAVLPPKATKGQYVLSYRGLMPGTKYTVNTSI